MIGDPFDPNTVYVGTYGSGPTGGLYVSTNALAASGSVNFTQLPNPAGITDFHVEEMFKLDDKLYVAADSDGVFRYDAGGWQQILAPSPPSGGKIEQFESLTGYKTPAGKHVIYAGGGGLDGNMPVTNRSIMRTVDAAAATVSWSTKAASTNWDNPMGGPGGTTQWWLAASNQGGCVGGNSYVASQLLVKPGSVPDQDEVLVGRPRRHLEHAQWRQGLVSHDGRPHGDRQSRRGGRSQGRQTRLRVQHRLDDGPIDRSPANRATQQAVGRR